MCIKLYVVDKQKNNKLGLNKRNSGSINGYQQIKSFVNIKNHTFISALHVLYMYSCILRKYERRNLNKQDG